LVTNYIRSGRILEARTLLEEGLAREPESAPLLTLLASTYFDSDYRRADELLSEAERIDPNSILVKLYRQIFEEERQKHAASKQTRGKKRKKR
jgi:Tfp pilus assembly protein PilF